MDFAVDCWAIAASATRLPAEIQARRVGAGVTATLLAQHGIQVFAPSRIERLAAALAHDEGTAVGAAVGTAEDAAEDAPGAAA
ncbi:hypothetical protein [Paraburkholderia phenazinium]|uniref:hypothetical protein n=1 Tax=Paraburkholderia phenazinium TaxID=60549 RepID=UPI00158DAB92|nr:hypothetical protein [Paraburkholderia phenazinium]